MTAYQHQCRECGRPYSGSCDKDCEGCGESLAIGCRMCGNVFHVSELDTTGHCEECVAINKRVAKRERDREIAEGYGDWLRDQTKDPDYGGPHE